MPGICYTRSNFFVKGGEVTTPTITGDIFPPNDVKNTLIELNNQLPNFLHTHSSLARLQLAYPMIWRAYLSSISANHCDVSAGGGTQRSGWVHSLCRR